MRTEWGTKSKGTLKRGIKMTENKNNQMTIRQREHCHKKKPSL